MKVEAGAVKGYREITEKATIEITNKDQMAYFYYKGAYAIKAYSASKNVTNRISDFFKNSNSPLIAEQFFSVTGSKLNEAFNLDEAKFNDDFVFILIEYDNIDNIRDLNPPQGFIRFDSLINNKVINEAKHTPESLFADIEEQQSYYDLEQVFDNDELEME